MEWFCKPWLRRQLWGWRGGDGKASTGWVMLPPRSWKQFYADICCAEQALLVSLWISDEALDYLTLGHPGLSRRASWTGINCQLWKPGSGWLKLHPRICSLSCPVSALSGLMIACSWAAVNWASAAELQMWSPLGGGSDTGWSFCKPSVSVTHGERGFEETMKDPCLTIILLAYY